MIKNLITTIGLVLSVYILYGQDVNEQGESFHLNQALFSDINYDYTASNHIDLQPGFDSEHNHTVKYTDLHIDKFGIYPPNNGVLGGPEGYGNGVVGAIEGSVSVNALGGAIYSIPINTPSDIGEIQPNLSVVYNSQSGNGLLGWGWTLGGLSAITRINPTLYHDDYLDGVDFVNDRFALDGKRLMLVNNETYGSNGAEYRTEVDGMSKIVSYRIESDTTNGPAWFKVWTAEGTIMEYGRTNDSRIGLKQPGDVCLWLLNRVEDRNGNYMTYHYCKGGANYFLSSISYTGNEAAGILPCYSVRMEYDSLSRIDEETSFIGNNAIHFNKLLKNIKILWWNDTIAQYDFSYYNPSFNSAYPYYRLKEVVYKCDGVSYNPTIITWGENDYLSIPDTLQRQVIVDDELWTDAFKTKFKFTGDFNGDGFTDIIAIKNEDLIRGDNPRSTYWAYIYQNTGPGTVTPSPGVQYPRHGVSFTLLDSIQLRENDNWIYVADFNLDGRDDFIIVEREGGLYHTIKIRPYITYVGTNGNLLFLEAYSNFDNDGYAIGAKDSEHLLIGDFLGNGNTDIILQIPYHSYLGGYVKAKFLYVTYENGSFNCRYYDNTTVLPGKVFEAADFNGDGITEIWCDNQPDKKEEDSKSNISVSQASIYKMTSYNTSSIFNTDGVLTNLHQLFLGDFNGDGKTDFLTYVPDSNGSVGTWQVNYFKETSLYWNQFDITSQMPIDQPGNRNYSMKDRAQDFQFIEIGDFDGDGKSDLVVAEGPHGSDKMYFFYGPLHWTNGVQAAFAHYYYKYMNQLDLVSSSNLTICTGNFCGRDNLAMLSHNTYIRLPSITNRYSVKEITDGMGNKSSFYYDYLTGVDGQHNNFYTWDPYYSNLDKDIYVKSLPMKAVKEVVSCNGIAQTPAVSTEYKYRSALFHRKGRGIIGFNMIKKTYKLANAGQKISTSYYDTDVMDNHCAAVLQQEITQEYHYPHKVLSKSLYFNSYFENYNNHKVFIPIVTKQEDYSYSLDNDWLLSKNITENHFQVETSNGEKQYYYNSLKLTDVNIGVTRNENHHNVNNCEFQSSTHTVYNEETPNDINHWIIKRPKTTLSIAQRTGDNDISQSLIQYAYKNNNSYLVDTITIYPGADQTNANGLATYTRFVYDAAGNVTEETLGAVNGALNERPNFYEYDRYRFKNSIENALGYKTQSLYDAKYGVLIKTIDENDNENNYWREDALGTTDWAEYADRSQTCTAKRWAYINDELVEDAPENASYYVWSKKSGQNPSKVFYDAADRELRTVNYGFNGEVIYQDIEYNNSGLVSKESLPYFKDDQKQWTEYRYDKYHRIDTTYYPDHTKTIMEYDDYHTQTTLYPTSSSQLQPQVSKIAMNAVGEKKYSVDPSNTKVKYEYYPDGKLKSTEIENHANSRVNMRYDEAGNRVELDDPNYGITTSVYNAYKELVSIVSPKFDTTLYLYDAIGRLDTCIEIGHSDNTYASTVWKYYESDGKLGLLKEVKRLDNDGIHKMQYSYDSLQRIDSVFETIENSTYISSISYDELSRVNMTTYPSGVSMQYGYKNGYLHTLKDKDGNILWKTQALDAVGQIKQYLTGNGVTTNHDYAPETRRLISQFGNKNGIIIQNFEYHYDDYGNLKYRKENKFGNADGIIESFEYDKLNRLVHIELNHAIESDIIYDSYGMGRMMHKESDGNVVFTNAQYSDAVGDKPHEMRSAVMNCNLFPASTQNISYTMFDQPKQISQNGLELGYTYGFDHQRRTMMLTQNNNPIANKIYVGNCEYDWSCENGDRVLTYLNGPNGVFAVVVQDNEGENLHYIYKDHLGSWTTITDKDGHIEQNLSYDAWGNLRNAETWTGATTIIPLFDRGFTGHEHLYDFGLINMNGRMYDPVMSSFLSPDNYMQCPDNSQNFNRYSYCLNNPLRYTDPSGELTGAEETLIFAACILVNRVLYNGVCNVENGQPFFQNSFQVITMTILQEGVSYCIGEYAQGLGAGKFLFQAGAHYLSGGFFTMVHGGDFHKGGMSSMVASIFSSVTDVATCNMEDGWRAVATIASGSISGGVTSEMMGGRFIDGFVNGLICSGLNHAMHLVVGPDDPPSPAEMKERVRSLVKAQLSLNLSFSSKALFDEKSGQWMGKNFKFNSMKWGGNRYTGGKYKFAQKASNVLKNVNRALTIYQVAESSYKYLNGDISGATAIDEIGFVLGTAALGDVGAAIGVGRALSEVIIGTNWYQDFKFNVNYEIMEYKIGTPNENNVQQWLYFINNYK